MGEISGNASPLPKLVEYSIPLKSGFSFVINCFPPACDLNAAFTIGKPTVVVPVIYG